MKILPIFVFLLLNILTSCERIRGNKQKELSCFQIDTLKNDEILEVIPIFGYRFIVKGDFDGDGIKEQLVERFISEIDQQETNKFYKNIQSHEQLIGLTMSKKPRSFVVADNKLIDTLNISSNPQLFGLSYLKNEGDLNGDGTDEVSYVVDWADYSSTNYWHIATYRNKEWKEIYSFPIWDWQLPNLPETFNEYGLFGMNNKIVNNTDTVANRILRNELMEFEGLVKKVAKNKIQIIFRNIDADMDTMIVEF